MDEKSFLWWDRWLGRYRSGFTCVRTADPEIKRISSLQAALFSTVFLFGAILLADRWFSLDDPGHPAYQRGMRFLQEGNSGKALVEFEQAVELAPQRVRYRLRLAWQYYGERRLQKMIDAIGGIFAPRTGTVAVLIAAAVILYYGAFILILYARSNARRSLHSTRF